MASWRDNLQQGSWRGLKFFVRDTGNPAGQRLAVFEMPDSDAVVVQALGRGVKEYRLEIYVAGDDYMAQRDAMEKALDQDGAGTLIHPYKGRLQVYAKHPDCRLKELWTQGRAAFFDCVFVEASTQQAPAQATSTADTSESTVAAASPLIAANYAPAFDGQSTPVQSAFTAALATVQTTISAALTFAGAAASQLSDDLDALQALAPDDALGYAEQLATTLADYVGNVVASFTPVLDSTLAPGFQDQTRLPDLPGDPSYGLGTLAGISATLIPDYATGTVLANWQTLGTLIEGSATAALVALYAQTSFASSDDADTARTQVNGFIVAQIAASAGNDPLIGAWRGVLTAAVTDLTTRAKQVPSLATLTTPAPMPALVLAQQLYQDGTQAPVIVQRNAVPHPLFCPQTIEYLQE
jgi:prophage DNA circulation protein